MILGQGNVAIDVARILLTPVDDLRVFNVYSSFVNICNVCLSVVFG